MMLSVSRSLSVGTNNFVSKSIKDRGSKRKKEHNAIALRFKFKPVSSFNA